jgi:hypothetical protein
MTRRELTGPTRAALACAAVFLLAGCGGPAATPANVTPEAGVDPAALVAPPVYSLLGFRDRLSLTSEQVARLDSIGGWLDVANRRAQAELRTASSDRDRGQPRGGMFGRQAPQRTPEELAVLDSLATNNRSAVESVRETLTEEQRERVCELVRPATEEGGRRQGGGRQQQSGGRDGQPGTMMMMGGRYIWPWCVPADAPAPAAPGDRQRPTTGT